MLDGDHLKEHEAAVPALARLADAVSERAAHRRLGDREHEEDWKACWDAATEISAERESCSFVRSGRRGHITSGSSIPSRATTCRLWMPEALTMNSSLDRSSGCIAPLTMAS